jgi:hypothetical protein
MPMLLLRRCSDATDEFFVLLKLHAMRLKNGELIIWLYSGYACYAHHMLIIGITVHTQSN